MGIDKIVNKKLNVMPVYSNIVHRYPYEGPCRTGEAEKLSPEYDKRIGLETFNFLKENLKIIYPKDVNLLDPVLLTWTDEFMLRDEQIKIFESNLDKIDIFLLSGNLSQYIAVKIAEKYRKPIGIVGCCASTDATAYLKSIGLEAYGYIDYHDSVSHFALLRTKKGIASTKVLSVLKGDLVSKGVVSGIRNLNYLTQKYGISFKFINAEEVLDEVSNLDNDGVNQARKIADYLIENAKFCYVKRDYVINSSKFYVAIKRLLEKYECNAFTIPCFEICATRRLDNDKYTFCLAHTLLKEEGIPSACEADVNALFAMDILMNITNSAPHMGNLHPLSTTNSISYINLKHENFKKELKKLKKLDNLIYIFHAVPTRYMKGRDKKPANYGIQAFTNSGWGATIRYDYNQDIGKEITFLRVDPTGTKMFAANAKILGDIGFKEIGCATGFYAQVNDVKDFFKKEIQFGHHYAWVYGNITEKLKELAEIICMEIITA